MENVAKLENHQSIYQENYRLAQELSIVSEVDQYESKTLTAENLIDLHIINIDMPDTGAHNRAVKAYLMTHLFDQEGNVADSPEMILLIDQANKVLEPYSLNKVSNKQDVSDTQLSLSEMLKKQAHLNNFLKNWLLNLKAMDYQQLN
ncbi:DUF6908 domain-containing protein [Thalassotalea fusca]